jgi:hypothetical protein
MKIAKGDTVYLGDGTKCEYGNQVIGGGHLVYILSRLHDSAEEDIFTVPQIVQEIYSSPPIAIKVERVKELDEQISDRVTRLIKIQEELREATYKQQELGKQITRVDALQHVVDFLNGRIKYLVLAYGSEYNIKPFSEAMEIMDRYRNGNGLRLLSLYGNIKGELSWGFNAYSDGSGVETYIWPFHSLESARDFIQKEVEREVDTALKKLHIYHLIQYEQTYYKLNRDYGFDLKLPPAAAAAIRKQKELNLKEEINKTQDKLKTLKADLSSLEPPE